MNPKTRTMPEEAYDALADRIYKSQPVAKGSPYLGLSVWMLDDEFQPTQCMTAIRWMYAENNYGIQMFQVDNAGDAILLIKVY
jgi:hypothetical protein